MKKFFLLFLTLAYCFNTKAQCSWQQVGAALSPTTATQTDIAIDGSGTPYVVYQDNGGGATVMKFNGSAWVTVGSAGFSAGGVAYTSIAIDGSGTPYVAYGDGGNGGAATVMKFNGSAWITVGSAGFSAGSVAYTSIAIDGSGVPYVVYMDFGNSLKATVMKFNGSSWVTVGSAGFSAGNANYTSIAIDGSGKPYVVYADNGALATVMKFDGSAWVNVGTAGFSAGNVIHTSIAIDGSGMPYVVYKDGGNGNAATVMKFDGSAWVNVGTAGFSAGQALYTSIAIDGSGTPYVAYQDAANSNRATVMKFDGSAWVNVAASGFSAGQADYTRIALDGSGEPYVVYRDDTQGQATVQKINSSLTSPTISVLGYTTATTVNSVVVPIGYFATPSGTDGWNPATRIPGVMPIFDPLPAGAKILGVTMVYDGVDQGWGGTGAAPSFYLAGQYIGGADVPFTHTVQPGLSFTYTGSIANYNYGGNNTLAFHFAAFGGWQGIIDNAYMIFYYGSSTTVCQGAAVTLSATVSGASTYSWSGGVTNGVAFTPSVSGIYTLTAVASSTCINRISKALAIVNVIPTPTLIAAPQTSSICAGNTVTLTANTVSKNDLAYKFNGVDEYISLGYHTALNPSVFTAEAWVKVNNAATGDHQSIMTSRYGDMGLTYFSGYAMYVTPSGEWSVLYGNGAGSNWHAAITGGTVIPNEWTHMAFSHDGSVGTLYINGAAINSTAVPYTPCTNTAVSMYIGAGGTDPVAMPVYYFGGAIDEVKIWSTARSAAQIKSDMNTCITGTVNGLEAYYSFQDTVIANYWLWVDDWSGNLHQGERVNMDYANHTVPGVQACNNISYLWSSGQTTNYAVVTPSATTTYSLEGTDGVTGCAANKDIAIINVSPTPTLSITGNSLICAGGTTSFTASGANTYLWSNTSGTFATTSSITHTSAVSAAYSVIGTNTLANCTSTANAFVKVGYAPTINITPDAQLICEGQTATMTATPAGYALDFDGINDYVETPPVYSAQVTYELWVKPKAFGGGIFSMLPGGGSGEYGFVLESAGSGQLTFSFGEDGNRTMLNSGGGNVLILNQWNHVAVTYDGSTMRIYLNGVLATSVNNSNVPYVTRNMTIGSIFTWGYFFNGQIDEFRIWNYARTQSDIQNNMNACFNGNENGLLAYYNMNGGISTTLADNSGSAYTGTLNNMSAANWVNGVSSACDITSYVWNTGATTSSVSVTPSVTTNYILTVNTTANCVTTNSTYITVNPVQAANIINTFAGNGTNGFSGDGGAATAAQMSFPTGIAVDAQGNIYISDNSNHRIRKVSTNGIITTIAGTGVAGFSGDGGAATAAQLNRPIGIAVDVAGNIYFADRDNHRIRKINTNGIITTIAGTGTAGFSGDGGAATSAQLNEPWHVAVDVTGDVYIADMNNHRIRKIAVFTGSITTIAGTGTAGFSGDGGAATAAQLNEPHSISLDIAGNIYIADRLNGRIRKITVSTGSITTIASGLSNPSGVTVDIAGNVYIAESFAHRIRKITASTGSVTIIAGTGANGFSGDGGSATAAQAAVPTHITINAIGKLYFTDQNNLRVRTFYPLDIIPTNSAICIGNTATLSASSPITTYTWSTGAFTSSVSVSPTIAATYSITNGCATHSLNLAVNPLPTLSITGSSVLCTGASVTQSVSGANTYTWNSVTIGNTVVLTPTVNTTYSVVGTNTLTSCSNSAVTSITVNALPVLNVAGNNTVCLFSTLSQTATGADTYSWSTGELTNTVNLAPTGNTTYTVTGTNTLTTCQNTAVTSVTVNPVPTVSVNSGTVCLGQAFTLTPSGATSYTYSSGTNTVSPPSNNSYFVNGSNAFGCWGLAPAVANVTVIALPVLSVSGNTTICFLDSLSQSVSGANSYSWVGTGKTAATVTLTPPISGINTFSVIGTSSVTGCSNQTTQAIMVYPLPIITINSNSIACTGTPLILTGGGANSYTWQPGNLVGSTVSYTPATTATYVATGTDSNNCIALITSSIAIPVYPSPQVTITPMGTGSVNLNIGSGQTGVSSWNPWTFNFADPLPAGSYITGVRMTYNGVDHGWGGTGASTSMYVAGQYIGGNVLTHTQQNGLTINYTGSIPNYVYGGNNAFEMYFVGWPGWQAFISNANLVFYYGTSASTVCAQQLITLSASESTGTITLNWSGGQTNNVPFPAPNASQVYTVSGTNSFGCTTSLTESITVKPIPTLAVNSSSMCTGQSYTFNVSGADTYTWSTASNNSSIVVNPLVTTVYTVSGTNSLNCTSSTPANLTVNITPTLSIAGSNTVCEMSYVMQTALGADSYTWSSSDLTNTINVNPLSNTSYSVVGRSSEGCAAQNTAVVTITVHPTPTITVNSGTLCAGNVFTMTPSGAVTYTFSNGSPTVNVGTSNTYSVTGTNSFGCDALNYAIATVTVADGPALSILGSSVVCEGGAITQTVTGAVNYTWSTGATTSVITVSPPTSTMYVVSGVNPITGCLGSLSKEIFISLTPVISVNSGNMCAGSVFTMTPGGAATYTYSSGSNTVSPNVNTSYFVTGTSAEGCVSTTSAIANVIINPLPVIVLNSGTICVGDVFPIVPSGANTYTFSSGTNTVNPSSTTSYSVWGTDLLGCVSVIPGVSTVSVNTPPTITAVNGTMCIGNSYTIVPSGAYSYTYSSGSATVSPTSDTSYSITGASAEGCAASNTAILTVSVMPLPVISVNSGTVCDGDVFTMTPSGALTYTYSTFFNTSTIVPASSTSYSVTGTSSLGCVSSNTAVASVTVMPVPSISVSSGLICANEVFTFTPNGAATYTYSSGSNTVSPNVSSTYTITGTSIDGCAASNTIITNVLVKPLPQIGILSNTAVCIGNSATLSINGMFNNTYVWSIGTSTATPTGSVLVFTPSVTDTYTAVATAANGCTNSATQTVIVNSLPVVTVLGNTVCPNEPFLLQPSGALTYTYSSGIPMVSILSGSAVYTVTGTDMNGCVSLPATATLTASNDITVSVSGNTLVCSSSPANITASGATNYVWSTGEFSASITPKPIANSTYTVIGSRGLCADTAVISVNVNELPTLTVSSTPTIICAKENATLSVTGAASSYTYTWSENNTQAETMLVSPTITTVYMVTATDLNGCENTAAITQSVSKCTDIEEFGVESLELKVYPNPNTGEFYIETEQEVFVSVLNVIGQVIKQEKLQAGKNLIDLNSEAKGIYFVEIKHNNRIKTVKVVKQG